MQNKSEISKLEKEILRHKKLYYSGQAKISDHEYDELEARLRELDPENLTLEMVGAPIGGKKIAHGKKMLSLQKTYDLDELLKWGQSDKVISTFKIDGSSCSLLYRKGKLLLAKTRGDGQFGENITAKVLFLGSIPKEIEFQEDLDIRGEIYCTQSSLYHLSEEMEARGLEKPQSQRNIVAGLLGRKENIDLCSYLSFQAFDLIDEKNQLGLKQEMDKFKSLKKWGFDIPEINQMKDQKSYESLLESTQEFMQEGDYLIDGLVFTYNTLSLHDELGETSHHPRYKMAFKFSGESKQTTIESITWQVSRNGILTPVAEVQAVELSGASISRVTLHNLGVVKEFNLKKDDLIEIERSGEVIPKFIQVIKSSSGDFLIPANCPSCDGNLEEVDIRLFCLNEACPAKQLEQLKHFVKVAGIDDLSSARLKEMLDLGLIKKVSDLYLLSEDQLIENLSGTKEKLATKLIKNIEQSKNIELVKFLTSLGIAGGGLNKCQKIIDAHFDTIEKVQALSVEELSSIEGFAQKSSEEFIRSLEDKKSLIQDLLKVGVKIKKPEEKKGSSLMGLKFCITGTLTRKRSEIANEIKEYGGQIVSSVSKNTDYLVTNDTQSSSSKFKKAQELSIPILSEDMLKDLLK